MPSLQGLIYRNNGLLNAFNKRLDVSTNHIEIVEYNGRAWTIGSKQFIDTPGRIHPLKAFFCKIFHLITQFFCCSGKKRFKAALHSLNTAFNEYHTQKRECVKAHKLMVKISGFQTNWTLKQQKIATLNKKRSASLKKKEKKEALLATLVKENEAKHKQTQEKKKEWSEALNVLPSFLQLKNQMEHAKKPLNALKEMFSPKEKRNEAAAFEDFLQKHPLFRPLVDRTEAEINALSQETIKGCTEILNTLKKEKKSCAALRKKIQILNDHLIANEKKISEIKKHLVSKRTLIETSLQKSPSLFDLPLLDEKDNELPAPKAPSPSPRLQDIKTLNEPAAKFLSHLESMGGPLMKSLWEGWILRCNQLTKSHIILKCELSQDDTLKLYLAKPLNFYTLGYNNEGQPDLNTDPEGGAFMIFGNERGQLIFRRIKGRVAVAGLSIRARTPGWAKPLIHHDWAHPTVTGLDIKKSSHLELVLHLEQVVSFLGKTFKPTQTVYRNFANMQKAWSQDGVLIEGNPEAYLKAQYQKVRS